jgi:two-component system, NarL family, response regulator LiaR
VTAIKNNLKKNMKSATQFNTNHKEILAYCISMALVLFLIKWLEARFIVFNYRLDFFIGAIAILFTVLGIWLALKLVKPKVETVVIEREVYVDRPAQVAISHDEIAKLGISKRELDVLHLMATGLSNEEIAGKLFIGLNTVKTHSSNIFLKLDVKRRTQAVEKAKRLNIIS